MSQELQQGELSLEPGVPAGERVIQVTRCARCSLQRKLYQDLVIMRVFSSNLSKRTNQPHWVTTEDMRPQARTVNGSL